MTLSLALIALLDFSKYKVIWLRPEHLEVVGNGIGVRVDVVGHITHWHTIYTILYPRAIAIPNLSWR